MYTYVLRKYFSLKNLRIKNTSVSEYLLLHFQPLILLRSTHYEKMRYWWIPYTVSLLATAVVAVRAPPYNHHEITLEEVVFLCCCFYGVDLRVAVRFYVCGVRHRRSNIDGRTVLYGGNFYGGRWLVLFYGIYSQQAVLCTPAVQILIISISY